MLAQVGGTTQNHRLKATRLAVFLTGTALLLSSCAILPDIKFSKSAIEIEEHQGEGGTRGALTRMGERMLANKKYAAAMPLFRRAHQLSPRRVAPLVGLGDALTGVGRHGEALKAYQNAYRRDSEDARVLRALGRTYLAIDLPDQALTVFAEALAIDANDAEAYNGLAVAQEVLGDHEGALDSFAEGVAADNDNLGLKANYGVALALGGAPEAAVEILEDAVQAPGASAHTRQNLALAYSMAGNYEAAQKVASIDLDIASTNQNMTFFSELKNMPPEARVRAVYGGIVSDRQDLRYPANARYEADPDQAAKAIARILKQPEEPAEPAVIVEQDFDVPPLLDPTGYAVQIAAYRKIGQLMPGWRYLSEKYSDIIGHLQPRRSEVDFGPRETYPSGFFYRLNAGELTGLAEAIDICKQLHAKGAQCWVRPPEPAEGQLPIGRDINPEPVSSNDAPPKNDVPDQPLVAMSVDDEQPEVSWSLVETTGDDGTTEITELDDDTDNEIIIP